ncbi:PQQ-dependent sugar dehydrogenase [Halorarum halophilum]|uniref:PQQ-dependent sugar dehydrogenase n=1 Tax=Halorarum halophilum TaxID=2743090 RepID=A0A7D5GE05_9EURY|nr:PQQ-dependent sugar dehydrogenase [Halobaculum halophilum]QLG29365.1 PQQ-dependent sugar dehydrogenase [Halobaculum halophilum]
MDHETSRRRVVAALFAGGATGMAGCGGEATSGTEPSPTASPRSSDPSPTDTVMDEDTDTPSPANPPDSVGLETLATGLEAPVDIAFAPDADRRYVVDQPGFVYVHESGGLRDEPFLDLGDSVEGGSEKGLLGIALHPEFAENRRLFVRYSAPSREGTPDSYSHTFVLSEFTATDDGSGVTADSERVVLEIPEPQRNHNAGSLAFGPDGYLYVGVGDGGGAGDRGTGHADDWYDGVDGGNGQDVTENLLGSILRMDVDGEASDGKGYAVPEDNPLVGREGLDEHYAWGLRNPWRFSFDGDDLFVGDVGQDHYEEVNLVEAGGNYGWNVKEGTHCFEADSCPDATPGDVRGGEPLVDPIVEYPHSGDGVSGVSVIGGHIYRGSAMPGLQGRYVFGDLGAGGRLFVASRPDDGGQWSTEVIPVTDDDAEKLDRILSFGRDAAGEVYMLGIGENGGGLHRVVPAE